MDYNERFNQVETLLSDLLKSNDRQNEILGGISQILVKQTDTLDGHTRLFELLVKSNDRMESELKLMRPILEKALEQDDRIRRLEEAVFRKGA